MAPCLAVRPRQGGDQADRGQARKGSDPAEPVGARRLSSTADPPPAVSVFAPAKLNLYLHVVGRRPDGYHLLDSLIAFADIGDRVTAVPADQLTLTIAGPEAEALAGIADDDNLVLRAARRLADHLSVAAGAALHLDKELPVASGIGGGSSDAAAALRALIRLWGKPIDDAAVMAIAAELGADVPACLAAAPIRIGGIGERLDPVPGLPPLGIVLANPRRPLPTAAVFRARRSTFSAAAAFDPAGLEADALIAALGACRNDLTAAAVSLVAEISAVLEHLAGLPAALLARMSGSGATCFALFADRAAAERAGMLLTQAEPRWWSRAGALLPGPFPVDRGRLNPMRAAPAGGSRLRP
jgi:4-diphosphocytidyl-2-C-methyl-D-erythritol kinase